MWLERWGKRNRKATTLGLDWVGLGWLGLGWLGSCGTKYTREHWKCFPAATGGLRTKHRKKPYNTPETLGWIGLDWVGLDGLH